LADASLDMFRKFYFKKREALGKDLNSLVRFFFKKEMNAGSGERLTKFKSYCTVFTIKQSKNG